MILSSLLFGTANAGDLALYWGQASAGSQQKLSYYCQNVPGDIYLISFLSSFGSGNEITLDISGYNDYFSGTGLLNAPELGDEIETCQSLGKKVLLSMGGAAGSYGFDSDSDAETVAEDLWNYFGGGTSSTRPFGDAVIDGFDLDGENNSGAEYYVSFVNKLRDLYATDTSKDYYVSAAPQCPYPDATTGDAIADCDLDFLFVQFYNNYCNFNTDQFNFDTWQNFATNSAPNKNVKIYVGLPGSSSAAGSGYTTIAEVQEKYSEVSSEANFGGFMVWDASQANTNVDDGVTFAEGLSEILGSSLSSSSSSSAKASASTSSSSTSQWVAETTSSSMTTSTPETSSSTTVWWTPESSSSTVWWTPESSSSTVWWTPETSSSTVWWTPETSSSSTVWSSSEATPQWTSSSTSSQFTPETTTTSSVWSTAESTDTTVLSTSTSQWAPVTTSSSYSSSETLETTSSYYSSSETPETTSSSYSSSETPESSGTVTSTSTVYSTSQSSTTITSQPSSTIQTTTQSSTTVTSDPASSVTTSPTLATITSVMQSTPGAAEKLVTMTSNGIVYIYHYTSVTQTVTDLEYETTVVTV